MMMFKSQVPDLHMDQFSVPALANYQKHERLKLHICFLSSETGSRSLNCWLVPCEVSVVVSM